MREADLHEAAGKFHPNNQQLSKALSEDSLKFMFVRHPFERLASAFTDKFEMSSVGNYIFKGIRI